MSRKGTREEREVKNLERLTALIGLLAETSDQDLIARTLADEADALLVEGLGVSGASRWWRHYTLETCGRVVGDMKDAG